jgi:hypothetical protein
MKDLEIGTKVKIGATGIIGTVAGIDTLGVHVEHKNDQGNLIRRLFIIEEISAVDEGEASNDGNETASDMLYGSSVQPSTFTLADGSTMQLGDVVRQAFEASSLNAKQWNDQANETREELIAAVVGTLKLVPEKPADETGNENTDATLQGAKDGSISDTQVNTDATNAGTGSSSSDSEDDVTAQAAAQNAAAAKSSALEPEEENA